MSKNKDSAESTPLPYGLYDQVIDRGRRRRLTQSADQADRIEEEKLDPGDGDAALTEHLRGIIRIALEAVVGDDRIVRQVALCNRLIEVLSEPDQADDRSLPEDVQRLLAIWPGEFGRAKPERPDTPLAPIPSK
jgi:hypothetical protein